MMSCPLKILSWNINGLRTQKTNLKTLLDSLEADIICLQETKITRDQLDETLAIIDGYYSFFSFSRKRSGYSGVVTYCKKKACPSYAQEGLGGTLGVGSLSNQCGNSDALSATWDTKDLKELDSEGRCMITQHPFQGEEGRRKLLTVINVYCPRADPDRPERAAFKLSFYELLRQRSTLLNKAGSHVLILGDVNTCHKVIDHCDPDEDEDFAKKPARLFLDQFFVNSSPTGSSPLKERTSNLDEDEDTNTQELRVVDTFRHFHPNQKEAFTCWCTQVNARATNYGTRIDYILCDEGFLPHVEDSFIHPDIQGSDHCPVSIRLSRLRFSHTDGSPPPICTKFYPEFRGSQQKLSSYFVANGNGGEALPTSSSAVKENKPEGGLKRKTADEGAVNSKKKSVSGGQSRQSTLSFFIKCSAKQPRSSSSQENGEEDHDSLSDQISTSSSSSSDSIDSQASCDETVNEKPLSSSRSSNTSSEGWGFLMKGLPPPPLCPGHKEPAVVRTVKKKGPNLNKQFYSCARGAGKEGDPNARCNFFKWVIKGK